MRADSHRESNAILIAWRVGARLMASVALLSLALAFGLVYDSGTFRSARAQTSADRGMTATAYKTDSLAEWHVFLAATNDYTEEIGELKYAENDVDEMEKIFRALGVKDENLIILKSSNKDPYRRTSQRSIELNYNRFISKLNSNSIAFVFLSGHGFNGAGNKSYYAPLDFHYDYMDETQISIDDMLAKLSQSPARFKWMCVDACRNDLKPKVKRRGANTKSLAISDVPVGVVLTQSCRSGQFSYEYGGEGAPFNNGLFTRAFVDAISGRAPEADGDRDGVVTMGEIRSYLETRVPKDADTYCKGRQNPVFSMKDASFDSIAKYPLFEDMPIFGHHPEEWREGQRLKEEAEELVKQKKYRDAGFKIQEAYRLLPDVDEIIQARERIRDLYYKNDNRRVAQSWYEKAKAAYGSRKYEDALSDIDKALDLDVKNEVYLGYKQLILDAMELYSQTPPPPPQPQPLEPPTDFNQPEPTEPLEPRPAEPFAEELPSVGGQAGASRTVTINGVEVVFRWCPPGEFMMGSPSNEEDRLDNETQHKVVITKGFWLAETETTQALWKAVMGKGNNPSLFKGDNLPVEQVSWDDCQEFIKKLNEQAKSTGLVFRLPSEAHWEYACRAGTTTPFSFGSMLNGDKANCDGSFPYGTNTEGKYVGETTPVGSYFANAWGLKDMHGNVIEWCQDWYDDYPTSTATDPTGPGSGSCRVIRGGGWNDRARGCRSALRYGFTPGNRYSLGFRLELDDSSSN